MGSDLGGPGASALGGDMRTILVPSYFTDAEVADFATKYFAPHCVPADVEFKRAEPPQDQQLDDREAQLRCVLREELLQQNYGDVNMMGCVMYLAGDKTAASRHDRRKIDAALAAMRRVALPSSEAAASLNRPPHG